VQPASELTESNLNSDSGDARDDRPSGSSYGQILKSSSILGGSKGLNYVISLVTIKAVAVLLGPEGVGLVGLYRSLIRVVGTLAGMGIGQSGVRDVAQACGTEDPLRIATTIKTLRRTCWVTGGLGCALTVVLAYPLSLWTFETGDRSWSIALLGTAILVASVSAGQMALLQGTRKIVDIAKVNVLSAAAGSIVSIVIYFLFGQAGVVPALIAAAVLNLVFSWLYARRVSVAPVDLNWLDTWRNAKSLLSLGLAFMWGALLAAVVGLVLRAVIVRDLGLDAAGIYTAAWSISGLFASFILSAMGTDFYPRLTAVADDHPEMNKLVNEQLEIGILLALPGLLATLAFAPLIMQVLFTAKFLPSAELLPWFVVGVLVQVIAFPLGYIQRAKGAFRWIYFSATEAHALHLILAVVLLKQIGLTGTAIAMPCVYVVHLGVTFLIARRLSGFCYSSDSLRLQAFAVAFILLTCAAQWLPGAATLVVGGGLTVAGTVFGLRGIAHRLGQNHRVVRLICKIPGGRIVCGL
jgi:PST family polysaccharide transporter